MNKSRRTKLEKPLITKRNDGNRHKMPMNSFGRHGQNLDESGMAILDVIGDFHDGFRYRLVMIQIMGQLLAENMERLNALLNTVGWEEKIR